MCSMCMMCIIFAALQEYAVQHAWHVKHGHVGGMWTNGSEERYEERHEERIEERIEERSACIMMRTW